MYPSRGNNSYGQQQQQHQPYSGQSAYGQNLASDGRASQMSTSSRHSDMLGGHPSDRPHYGGQYTSVYGSMALSSALQAPGASAKGSGSSTLEGRSGYGSSIQESPKFTSGDYSVASQKYGQKVELSDYPQGDRRQYVERSGVYTVRDSQNEQTARFSDSIAYGHHQHQADIYDRLDTASALRKELLEAQALQSASIEGSSRQADYLAARAATVRHTAQELLPYSGRMDPDPNTLSMISGLSHRAQHAPSLLGAAPAPRRDVDDLVYTHTSANPGYGVSLPPGRNYASGKGLHGTPLEPDYSGAILARAGYARLDDLKDDRGRTRELDRREEERRREILRDREKERERDRDRERERERERERKRERERILERREKERDRETKRIIEVRRERVRTPPRISRDRGGSSSTKAERSRVETLPRRRSPVKEKRREYVCKVYSSSLVDAERDYLSIDKRYPRLFTSPECSKVIVNWSRENLKVPLNVPVSFEHDFVQDDTENQHKEASTVTMVNDPVKSQHGSTRWNAKIVLMSGLSRNALEELSSERDYEDRIPHFCNMLRFACLKNGNALMAIGGLWEAFDGNDPSVDKSTLVQTAIRHAKDLTGLDLKNCQRWNPFIEIHYDRVGKNGLFSHKEVTVLYIPDLSDCLPSVDAWRDQWLAHKKAVAERALKREISREKKEGLKDKESVATKDKKVVKPVKKKASESASKLNEKTKGKVKESEKEGVQLQSNAINSEKKNQVEVTPAATASAVQKTGSGKKKIIRKVIKKKVVEKDNKPEIAAEQSDTLDPKTVEDTTTGDPSSVKTFKRKKVIKKVPIVKKEDESTQSKVTPVKEQESSENKSKNEDTGGASGKTTVKKEDEGTQSDVTPVKEQVTSENKSNNGGSISASGKTMVKKKIIKRVTRRKVVAKDKVVEEAGVTKVDQSATVANPEIEVKLESNEPVSKSKAPIVVPEQSKDENKNEDNRVKEEKKSKVDGGSLAKIKINNKEKSKDGEKSKEGKDIKKVKEVKDKKKDEELPRHPGLILQTKDTKYSNLRSTSFSLDSLLGYDDNDIEESTFELSLFAEAFYEMLQYQMGSRILTFLQKVRINFVTKRNQKKRQLEETSEKEKVRTSAKRAKTDNSKVESKSVKTETQEETHPEDDKTIAEVEITANENVENTKPEGEDLNEDVEEEDPEEEDPEEEDPEEDEDMTDANPKDDTENEEKAAVEKDVKSKNVKNEKDGNAKETTDQNIKSEGAEKQEKDEKEKEKEKAKVGIKKKENIDKELLQAFRFFDRNRVGHIRVEDMRLIIHNLGNFLSHRDVKDLVQSALLESNTGRDDRILYNKLVRMDI